MTHELARIPLGHDPTAAATARRAVRAWLAQPPTPEPAVQVAVIEDAELVASELVANSVKHGLPPILMTLHLDPDAVIVKVHDGGPSANLHHSDGGRGLHLVRALTRIFELTVDPDHTSAVAHLPRSGTQH